MPSTIFRLSMILFVFGICTSSTCDLVSADDKHHKHRKHHHHHNPGFTGVALTPDGVGFTFQNRNFGIGIAPGTLRSIQQRRWGDYGHLNREPTYAQPTNVTPVIPEPVLAPIVDANVPQRLGTPLVNYGPRSEYRPIINTIATASNYQAAAEHAFRNSDFAAAAKAIGHATLEDPENGFLHLFAAQIAFAVGDYDVATEAILVATERLESADWFFIGQNYQKFYRENEYVRQMDLLNEYCENFPNHSFAQSLRAFHFAGLGHAQAANQMVKQALKLNPQDELAQRLAKLTRDEVVAPSPKLVSSNDSAPLRQSATPRMYSILEN